MEVEIQQQRQFSTSGSQFSSGDGNYLSDDSRV
jgi:hypothetical protein